MRRPRVFLDANVLVDAQVRDLILRAAETGLVDVRWSRRVLDETRRALSKVIADPAACDRLVGLIDRAFPHAQVTDFEHLEQTLDLPDSDDRHVLAAAVTAECDLLVTYNLRDFPEEVCGAHDILAVDVDEALMLLSSELGATLQQVVKAQIAAMRRPAVTVETFIRRLSRTAPQAAMLIGASLGLAEQQRMLAEVIRSEGAEGPQAGVRALLDALERGDEPTVSGLVDEGLRVRLDPESSGDAHAVFAALTRLLQDALTTDGWGFATAWRPQSPDIELVKLIRGGQQPRVTDGPELVQGHLFYMRKTAAGWILSDLDGPDPGLVDLPQRDGP